ncbi:hypothetical protein NQZ68_004923 [Dissostichus eleginoides]|nr:hypothetical protein NQZ68_004923 [Dissostichus eleginoides]
MAVHRGEEVTPSKLSRLIHPLPPSGQQQASLTVLLLPSPPSSVGRLALETRDPADLLTPQVSLVGISPSPPLPRNIYNPTPKKRQLGYLRT